MSKSQKAQFAAAIEAAKAAPDSDEKWDEAEGLAGELDSPDEVASAYGAVLERDLSPELAVALGQRAARFHEEWFGEDPSGLVELVRRVLDLEPGSEWAFQKLTVGFTVGERWSELFELYDSALSAATADERRVQLLEEAYQSAKDLANDPERAIRYLKQLLDIAPQKKLSDQLERLLEKHERWKDLIELWESRAHELSREEAAGEKMRAAAIWFDNLRRPDRALDTIQQALPDLPDDADACKLLERIATTPATTAPARNAAMDILRARYEASGRQREIVRVLEAAMALVGAEEQQRIRREMAERLGQLEDHGAAMDHHAELLKTDPGAVAAQRSLRQLAQKSDAFARYASVLQEAAANCTDVPRKVALLVDAARTRLDMLEDEAAAIRLFQEALDQDGIPRAEVLSIGRRQSELLARHDRTKEQLDVLERLAGAETVASSRRAIIGDVARLAESLGEVDRALAAWKSRLDDDPSDAIALDATIELLEKEKRWEQLMEALRVRVETSTAPGQKRTDLIRIARVYEDLGQIDRALSAWVRLRDEFGEDAPTVEALARLLATTEQWEEMGQLFERASATQTRELSDQLVRLGEAYLSRLDSPERAASCFLRALNVDPRDTRALEGAVALLDQPATRGIAADALGRAYRETSNWIGFLDLVEPRMEAAKTPEQRLHILREAAEIQERRSGDLAAALGSLARAFPLAPQDRILEDNLVRLARETSTWQVAIDAYRAAIDALQADPHAQAQLRLRAAALLERELDDKAAAHSAYMSVVGAEPDSSLAVSGAVRLGSQIGRWNDAATAIVANVRATGAIDGRSVDTVERAAAETGSFDEMTRAFAAALDQGGIAGRNGAELYWRLGRWQLSQLRAGSAARQSFERVIRLDDTRTDAVIQLATLQRETPGPELYATLTRLVDRDPSNLDILAEAAETAVQHLGDGEQLSSLNALLSRASAGWRGTAAVTGEREPKQCVEWAVEKLVDLYLSTRRGHQALDLLVEASRLPFDDKTRRKMRQRAAQIADDELRDTAAAIEMYRAVLAQAPDDAQAIEKLAAIYQREDKMADLLALRRHELSLSPPAERKLSLRLELAHIIGEIERRGGRLEVLRANLEESPGHEQSIDAMVQVLNQRARHGELVDLLWEQARKLEKLEQPGRAARLWAMAADVAENQAGDASRAIEAYRRVVKLSPTGEALDSLARLYVGAGRPADAIPWLEQRLTSATQAEQPALVQRLARAHIEAGKRDSAVVALERAVASDTATLDLRTLLAGLYRESGRWEPLARLLTDTLPRVSDPTQTLALAREAAEIYSNRLKSPANAIPALERALAVSPDERELRVMMARGLRVAGSLDDARAILDSLIAEFGRRRSTERAAIHVELGAVARAQGRLPEALEELELASRMDTGNAQIQKTLAELARENGKIDMAERSLRALLLLVRREPPGDDDTAVGVSEVLYELASIAKERGDAEKGPELLESALEAAGQSDAEARRFRRAALARGDAETALRALRSRLDVTENPNAKAQLYADLGDVLAQHLDRPREALEALLSAIGLAPSRLDFHDSALELARRHGEIATYVNSVGELIEKLRRDEELPMVSRLLMRLGEICEREMDDLPRARVFFEAAEQQEETRVEALHALSRVYGAMDDPEAQTRALDQLTLIALESGQGGAQAGALYRLAELQVKNPDLIDRGLDLLRRALEAEPRYQQAASILQVASKLAPDNMVVLQTYEPVARAANDAQMLLDFLERRARHPSATPAQVKEAVDLAVELEEPERGEALLSRAVDAARASREGIAGAVWALTGLAERKLRAGELEAARDLLVEVADYTDGARLRVLGLELAQRASKSEDTLGLAADVYESLRQRDPSAREIWEPLFAVHRQLGDARKLQSLVSGTLPTLVDTRDRNTLRLGYAEFLTENAREGEAVEILRDALLDDPDNLEAGARLERVLIQRGDDEGIADFLWQRFEDAKERRNPETVADVGVRLAELLDRLGSGDSLAVCRDALAIASDDVGLLRAVLERLSEDSDPRERAQYVERLLGLESAEAAPALALQLYELYATAADAAGAQRALELGHRAAPEDGEILEQLENWYRERGQWSNLARLIASDAERIPSPLAAVARYRAAATVYRDQLHDLHGAVEVLRKAHGSDPESAELVAELASCLVASGDTSAATIAIGEALSGTLPRSGRVDLLLLRSDLRMSLGQEDQAIEDLEEASTIDASRARHLLVGGLEQRRASAQSQGDTDSERAVTMRLVDLFAEQGDEAQANQLLLSWIQRVPDDREALIRVRDMDTAAERWQGVIAACSRLVGIERGEAQVDAATRLARAAEAAGQPVAARQGLEAAYQAQPDSGAIRGLLRQVYEWTGSYWELAHLLIRDAECATNDDSRYEYYRASADIFVNRLGNTEAALAPAQKAKEIRPEDHDTLILLADILTHSGHPDEAAQMLGPAINAHKRRTPQLAALQHRMAKVYEMTGDRQEQLSWLKKAFDVDRKDGVIAAELAHLATELGDYDLALKPLRAITLMETPGPVTRVMALLWEAKIEAARGNRAKAELWAKKALREDPNYAEAEEFLNSIAE